MNIIVNENKSEATKSLYTSELNSFLENWDVTYKQSVAHIPLFIDNITREWSDKQKKFFVKIFYHARGHFHNFLWHMGNHAPNLDAKEIILKNIMEEFGGRAQSHEKLYITFAESLGVHDIYDETLNQQNNLPFIKKFNHGHIERLITNLSWEDNLSVFSAYERLDNIDYANLLKLVKSLGVSEKDSLFFRVHIHVEHFQTTHSTLQAVWIKDKQTVMDAFSFIASHQLQLWKNLSDAISKYL
jgi:hypothetical protein